MKSSEYLTSLVAKYETKVKGLVQEFDLKTTVAKNKGKKQIELFSQEVKKRREVLEKKLGGIVNKETEKINSRLENLVSYLRSLSIQKEAKAAKPKKASTRKKKSPAKKKKPLKAAKQ